MQRFFTGAALLVAAGLISAPALADGHEAEGKPSHDWTLDIGLGGFVSPEYVGSDEYEFSAFPNIGIDWKGLAYANVRDGIGVNYFRTENITLGAALGYDFGRDGDGDLEGMDDIDGGVTGRLYGSFAFDHWKVHGTVTQYFGDTEGTTVQLGIDYGTIIDRQWMITAGPSVTYATEDYMNTYFGVTSTEAGRTSFSQYTAGSGIASADLDAAVTYLWDQNWSVTGIAGVKMLSGDAADSPITKEDTSYSAGLVVNYRLGW